MRKANNVIFSCIIALTLVCPLAYMAINAFFPAVVNAPVESELENRTYTALPEPHIRTIANGEIQNQYESYIADHIPGRDMCLLANAALQRASISLSAQVAGYDIYPTFFDSDYYVIPSDGVIVSKAELRPTRNEEKRSKAWIDTLNDVAKKHPEISFVYDCVVRHDQSEVNPTYHLLSGEKVSSEWITEHILDKLDPSIDSFTDTVDSYQEIKDEWIPTEEHWTIQRALRSYNKIAKRLSLKEFKYENEREVIERCYGDYSRVGLDLDFTYSLYDTPSDFSDLKFYKLGDAGGAEIKIGKREAILSGELTVPPYSYHGYTRFYGGGSSEVVNEGANNGKTALIVSDSLLYPLRRVIASNYEHSVFLLPGNDDLKGSFESYLEKYRPDDVIIMIHATKYRTFAAHSPEFVGLG